MEFLPRNSAPLHPAPRLLPTKTPKCYINLMKKFIVINESFVCQNCDHNNPPQEGSCRNHCRKCLYSLHVDKENPGDRQSICKSPMAPVSAKHSGKKGWMIIHKCLKCSKEIPNKAAEDDDFDQIIKLTNEPTGSQKTRK